MTLPTTLNFGVVRDWGGVVGASLDSDTFPDVSGAIGTVTFTPSVAVQMVSDSPRSRWLSIQPHRFSYDAAGILRDASGNDGVTLIATDSPGLSRQDWQWVVSFDLGGKAAAPKQFAFELPGGTTVDLADVAPVAISNGVAITRGLPGIADDTSVADLVVNTSTNTHAEIVTLISSLGGGGGGGTTGPVGADNITDATATGRALLRAINAAAARGTIGAQQVGDYATTTDLATGLAGKASPTDVTQAVDAAKARSTHTGTQSADTLTDGSTNRIYTTAEKTKLAGVATGATVNRLDSDTDALLAGKISNTRIGEAGGVAALDGTGKVPQAQIPSVALTDYLGTVSSEAAMLALVGDAGDWVTRTDLGTDWQITGSPTNSLSSWRQMSYPASPVSSVAGRTGAISLSKNDVALGNVDNTADADKPVSGPQVAALDAVAASAKDRANHTGTQSADTIVDGGTNKVFTATEEAKLAGIAVAATANRTDAATDALLAAKAPLASPAFTGTPTGINKTHVGLANVDNTADAAKPVSSAQQAALNLKANAANPAFTGTPTGLTKAHVGLGSVDNTADSAKPVSAAQQTALDAAKNRANHVGTQDAATTLTGLAAVATTGAYNDLTGKPTIPTPYTDEQVMDLIGSTIVAGAGLTKTLDDAGNTVTLAATGSSLALPFQILPTDGTTDIGPLIQSAYDNDKIPLFQPGVTYLWDTSVYLDTLDPVTGFVLDVNRGIIKLGPNLTSTTSFPRESAGCRFAIYPNTYRTAETGTGANKTVVISDANRPQGVGSGSLRGLVVRDAVIDGQDAIRGFAFANRTGCSFENVTLYRARICHTRWDYADCDAYLTCYNRGLGSSSTTGPKQMFFEHFTSGDGIIVTNPKQNGSSYFGSMTVNRGAVISGVVAASFFFERCSSVEFHGGHFEAQKVDESIMTIRSSQVTFRGCNFYEHDANTSPSIYVDDSYSGASADSGSEVTFDNCIGMQLWSGTTTNAQYSPFLEIASITGLTRIVARDLKGMYATTASGGNWYDGVQPRIVSTESSTVIQQLLDSNRGRDALASGNFHLHRNLAGDWRMEQGQIAYSTRQSAAPAIGSAGVVNVAPGLTGGTMTNGQLYEYTYAVIDALGNYSAAAAPASGTVGTPGMTRLLLNTANAPAHIRIWRKTGTGVMATPDRYIDLSIRSNRTWLYDTGTYVQGRPWVTTSVPVPNTVAATNNTQSAILINDTPLTTGGTFSAISLAPGGSNDIFTEYGGRTAGIIETMSRDTTDAGTASPSLSAGLLALTYFTPDQTVTVANLTSATRANAAGGGTLAKMGLYSVDGAGALTCVARTASDTTLWQTANTSYTRAIADNGQGGTITSVALARGQRYAFAVLHVGSTSAPTLTGHGTLASIAMANPRRSGYLSSQTDMPATITAAAVAANTANGNYYYGRMS